MPSSTEKWLQINTCFCYLTLIKQYLSAFVKKVCQNVKYNLAAISSSYCDKTNRSVHFESEVTLRDGHCATQRPYWIACHLLSYIILFDVVGHLFMPPCVVWWLNSGLVTLFFWERFSLTKSAITKNTLGFFHFVSLSLTNWIQHKYIWSDDVHCFSTECFLISRACVLKSLIRKSIDIYNSYQINLVIILIFEGNKDHWKPQAFWLRDVFVVVGFIVEKRRKGVACFNKNSRYRISSI